MSHHGPNPLDLGPTGHFPKGKFNKDDEGEIRIGISCEVKKGVIVIDFGTKVTWIGLEVEQAKAISDSLQHYILEIQKYNASQSEPKP